MKWLNNRFLPLVYVLLLAGFVVIGCTGKQDPFETLVMCGNHSCGDLAMVTTDTSSKGYHYLNPTLSPDGSSVLFTADWNALPADAKEPEDEYYVNYRQLIVFPYVDGGNDEPSIDLEDQDAELIRLVESGLYIQGGIQSQAGALNFDKGDPIWEDDNHVIFIMRINAIGQRIFRGDISDINAVTWEPLFLEPTDYDETPRKYQHANPQLSPDGRWLLFVRSGCTNAEELETCDDMQIWAIDMSTAAADNGYGVTAFPISGEYKRIERPAFSPDSRKIAFSSYLDVLGYTGADQVATEIFTMDFDTTGFAANDTVALDNNLERITFTSLAEGDPLNGILNYYPQFSDDGQGIYFISQRRGPATTVHARALWQVPANGSLEPELYFFTRYDDTDPYVMPGGKVMLSSTFGFPTEILDAQEEAAYNELKQENESLPDSEKLTETEMQKQAAAERRLLENFEGVMSHVYVFDLN